MYATSAISMEESDRYARASSCRVWLSKFWNASPSSASLRCNERSLIASSEATEPMSGLPPVSRLRAAAVSSRRPCAHGRRRCGNIPTRWRVWKRWPPADLSASGLAFFDSCTTPNVRIPGRPLGTPLQGDRGRDSDHATIASMVGSSARASISSTDCTMWNCMWSRTSAGTSSRSGAFRSGTMTSVKPAA